MRWLRSLAAATVATALLAAAGCQATTSASGHLPTSAAPARSPKREVAVLSSSGDPASSAPELKRTAPTAAGVPDSSKRFTVLIQTSRGDIAAPVAPFNATVHPDGTAEPIDPPHNNAREWATAAWIQQSAYPAAPPVGTTYIYGHACHYHVCSFTRLEDAQLGDYAVVTTPASQLSYRICGRGLSPKTGNLLIPACRRHASANLILVTCHYEQGDTSTSNLVLAATLVR